MKITDILLTNVGPYPNARATFTRPLVLFFGANGLGKTTVRRAIELVVRGEVNDFRGTKALNNGSLVGPADQVAKLGVRLVNGERTVEVRRQIAGGKLTTSVNGKAATEAVYDYFSPPTMRDPDGVWKVILNASHAFELDDRDFRALFLGLVDQRVPPEALADLPMKGLVTPPTTFDEVAAAYDLVYKARTEAKRVLAARQIPEAPKHPRQDLAAIRTKLETYQAQEKAMIAAQSKSAGQRETVQAERERALTAVERVEIRLKELGERADVVKLVAELDAGLADMTTANAAAVAARAEWTKKRERLSTFKAWDARLGGLGAACVISSDIPCPLSTDKRTEIRGGWAKTIGTLDTETSPASEPAEPASTAGVERKLADARKLVAAIEQAEKDLATARAEVARLDARLAAIPDVKNDESGLTDLRARIQAGEANRLLAAQINAAHDAHESATTLHADAVEKVAALEKLVAAFDPKGPVIGKLLGDRLAAAIAALNTPFAAFGFKLAISTEPWSVRVNGRHPLLMSESQRFRAGVALQIALGELTGARWLFLDGLEVLQADLRNAVLGMLLKAIEDKRIEQAIVTATPLDEAVFTKTFPPQFEAFRITGTENAADSALVPFGAKETVAA